MTAKQLLHLAGKNLLGKRVITDPMGEYPGGMAMVIEIDPEMDIAFMVQHPTWKSDCCRNGQIGILDFEEVDGVDDNEDQPKPFKFLVEFHRTSYEKAFLEIEVLNENELAEEARKISTADPRLDFEPMSSVMEIAA